MPTPVKNGGLIVVTPPFKPVPREERRFSLKAVPPLLDAITKLNYKTAPHRIIAYQTSDGLQFNAAYFDDEAALSAYSAWFEKHALSEAGQLHTSWKARFLEPSEVPRKESWLWGTGYRELSDTRGGEYQLGNGHRYSRMMFRDEAAKKDAEQAALDPQFEASIAGEMEAEGVEYFGRLVMSAPPTDGGLCGGWFTKSRYGSLLDVQRGTWLLREMIFKEEIAKWFSSYESVTGEIASTHLITPKWPDGSSHPH